MINENTLIYDIETKTFGKVDAERDVFRVFGCYSYKHKKDFVFDKIDPAKKMIDEHKYLVGFNNAGFGKDDGYDNRVLKRYNVNFYDKIIIDLRNIFKQRASQMKIKEGMLGDLIMSYSLDYITRLLGLVDDESAKGDLDYNILKKDTWTDEEKSKIKFYTKRDIEITKKLYEWVEDYFEGFKSFISQEDVNKKIYLTSSTAKFTYKAICKAMKWSEEYNKSGNSKGITGAYVGYPSGEKYEGDIYCLDFASLYPHIMIQCNLYGRKKEGDNNFRPTWNGNMVWSVPGEYYADRLSEIGKLLQRWFKMRKELKKKGNKKEYTLKIMLNTIYGLLNNPFYKLVYDNVAGQACTKIGLQWIKFTRKKFNENGYNVIYTDTDSVYIKDPFNDKAKMLAVKDKIIDEIKKTVPFPQNTFEMDIDDEIKYIYFFRGKQTHDKKTDAWMDDMDKENKKLGFLKKNYIYVTKDDRVVIKNLGIRKKSNSPLSRKIFWEYLVPNKIKKGQSKISKTEMKHLIESYLKEDLNLIKMRIDVGNPNDYANDSNKHAQIAKMYGAGIHFLIPNKKGVGSGKNKFYCTEKEFKEKGLTINDIDLDGVWNELEYFIKQPITKSIFEF